LGSANGVRLLVRNTSEAEKIFKDDLLARASAAKNSNLNSDTEVVLGDLKDRASLEKFVAGLDIIYLNLSVRPGDRPTDFLSEREGLDQLLDVLKTNKQVRLMYLSSLVMNYQNQNGFRWWVFDIKQEAVRKIKESGHAHSIFYPSSFMENLDQGGSRSGNRLNLAGWSLHKMYFISGQDYAKQVLRSLSLPGSHEFTVQGPEAHTYDEAAEIFVANYAKTQLKISRAPLGLLKILGRFSRNMNYVAHILEALNNYPEVFTSAETWKQLGQPEITLKEYARRLAV